MPESNPHQEQETQKRRSTRIVQAVPLTVTGVDALGRPFQERTSTLIINCHGCRYQSKHYVLKNMWVTLEVPHNEADQPPRSVRGRVTWIQRPRTVRELFQIGLELEAPGNIWGIAFPPADWFPFPESAPGPKLEVPAPSETPQPAIEGEELPAEEAPAAQAPVPEEGNLRVLPLPAGVEAPAQFARHMARLVADAKQQIQSTARESATHAVAAETRPLLAVLQTQLKDAATKSAAAAVTAEIERAQQETLQRLEKEREASMNAMLAQLSREIDQRLSEFRQKIDAQMAEVERARRGDFEQQLQSQIQQGIQKLESLTASLGTDEDQARAVVGKLQQTSAQAAADEMRRWQEHMDQRSADARARLAQMEQTARRLGEQIAAATAIGEAGWRGLFEADLAAAGSRLQEKIETGIEEAARQAADRIAKSNEASAKQVEQQLQQRINAIGNAHARATAEAESALGTLRGVISKEAARGEAAISQLQQIVEQLESRRNEFSSFLQSASEEWPRRAAAILDSQTAEMSRRAESAVAVVAGRLQPTLEAAGRESVERLAAELEQRFATQIAKSAELLDKLTAGLDQSEKALAEHQQRIWQVSDRGLQEMTARGKEILAQIEEEFGETARTASTRWLSELEAKATETSHSTFETLFKTSEWYEKKVQTQMQSTLEKGIEQTSSRLREKAAEMSGLYARELDHYSRSFVEHAQTQMQENARDAAERANQQIMEAGDAAAAKFTERAAQIGREQLDLYASKTKDTFDQSSAYMEASATQVRSKLESDARNFAAEFQQALSQHAQQMQAHGRQELAAQIDQAKAGLLMVTQAQERSFQESLTSLGAFAMDQHKERLENASNSWLLTTVSKLNQQSESLIEQLAEATEKRLKSVCSSIFAEMGNTLGQRLAGLAAPLNANAASNPASIASPEDKQK